MPVKFYCPIKSNIKTFYRFFNITETKLHFHIGQQKKKSALHFVTSHLDCLQNAELEAKDTTVHFQFHI